MSAVRFLLLSLPLAVACGTPQPAEPPPKAPPVPTEAAPAEDAMPEGDSLPSEEAVDEAAESSEPGESTDSPPDPDAPREVLYKVTPKGLVVEVEGVSLLVTAEAVRKGGGWGVRVDVEAESLDDATHRLLSPSTGPLAFAVQVTRKGNVEKLADEREGDDEQLITPGDPTTFSREWPPKGTQPAFGGNKVKIQTGLWGLATEGGRRRPVKKLAVVHLVVAGGKPKAFVNPPE